MFERIEKLFYSKLIVDEFNELKDMPYAKETYAAVMGFLEPLLSKEQMFDAETLICETHAAGELRGFIVGFRYALGLFMECGANYTKRYH